MRRGDIYLCPFPQPDKARPVVVLTRRSSLDLLNTVSAAPVTSTVRSVASEVFLDEVDGMNGPCAINLHQILTVPKDRLGKRIGALSPERTQELCAALRFALGCD